VCFQKKYSAVYGTSTTVPAVPALQSAAGGVRAPVVLRTVRRARRAAHPAAQTAGAATTTSIPSGGSSAGRPPFRRAKRVEEVVRFQTVRRLLTLSDSLKAHRVTQVAMEATGVYWKPVWAVLEDDFELLLVNARHVKQVTGRKTDVSDAAWLCQLAEAGLLRASFVPPKPSYEPAPPCRPPSAHT
jgi:Transposase